jgi:organic radical activating enzyme
MKNDEFFPIKTATACALKWQWSTIFLQAGTTYSCARASQSFLTPENFNNFHNTEEKIDARKKMLDGQWPGTEEKKYHIDNCGHCRKIEDDGGFSDRQQHLEIPNLVPEELKTNPNSLVISPTTLEVYFSNKCNLACNYCNGRVSSKIAAEDERFGNFKQGDVEIKPWYAKSYSTLVPYFWKWFDEHGHTLKRLHILGGEPFYQDELAQLIDAFDKNPNSNCEFNIVTNLVVKYDKLKNYIESIKKLVAKRKIKRFDLTCSIDCWGPQQEYVRLGMNLEDWEKNFQYVVSEKWIYLNINSTVGPLTIKTMPELYEKINFYRKNRKINQFFDGVQGPIYWQPQIFGKGYFTEDFTKILNLMPETTQQEINVKKYLNSYFNFIDGKEIDIKNIKNLLIFLKEKDRRRNTDYKKVFPWLEEFDVE